MDRIADRILKSELMKLDLKPTNGELIQHRLWATIRLDLENDSKNIYRAEKWLLYLLDANQTSHAFYPKAFLWAIREVWFAPCYQVPAKGKPILKRVVAFLISRNNLKYVILLTAAVLKHGLRKQQGRSKSLRH